MKKNKFLMSILLISYLSMIFTSNMVGGLDLTSTNEYLSGYKKDNAWRAFKYSGSIVIDSKFFDNADSDHGVSININMASNKKDSLMGFWLFNVDRDTYLDGKFDDFYQNNLVGQVSASPQDWMDGGSDYTEGNIELPLAQTTINWTIVIWDANDLVDDFFVDLKVYIYINFWEVFNPSTSNNSVNTSTEKIENFEWENIEFPIDSTNFSLELEDKDKFERSIYLYKGDKVEINFQIDTSSVNFKVFFDGKILIENKNIKIEKYFEFIANSDGNLDFTIENPGLFGGGDKLSLIGYYNIDSSMRSSNNDKVAKTSGFLFSIIFFAIIMLVFKRNRRIN